MSDDAKLDFGLYFAQLTEHEASVYVVVSAAETIDRRLITALQNQPYVSDVRLLPSNIRLGLAIERAYEDWSSKSNDEVFTAACERIATVLMQWHDELCGYWGKEQLLEITIGNDLSRKIYYRPDLSPEKMTPYNKLGEMRWHKEFLGMQIEVMRQKANPQFGEQLVMINRAIDDLERQLRRRFNKPQTE